MRYQTNGYNQFFQRWAQKAPKFWDVWFSIGVAFGAITMIVGIITITYAGIQIALSVKSYISSSDTISESGNLHKRSDIVNEQRRQDDQVFLPMVRTCPFSVCILDTYVLICNIYVRSLA